MLKNDMDRWRRIRSSRTRNWQSVENDRGADFGFKVPHGVQDFVSELFLTKVTVRNLVWSVLLVYGGRCPLITHKLFP